MHRWIRKLDRVITRPFEFVANFFYYAGQPNYGVRLAWRMASKTLPDEV